VQGGREGRALHRNQGLTLLSAAGRTFHGIAAARSKLSSSLSMNLYGSCSQQMAETPHTIDSQSCGNGLLMLERPSSSLRGSIESRTCLCHRLLSMPSPAANVREHREHNMPLPLRGLGAILMFA
jgi:hypothetical protein